MLTGRQPPANSYPGEPIAYAEEYLGVTLWQKHKDVINALMHGKHKVLVRSGHSIGKGFVIGCFVSWFYDNHDPGITLLTAPTRPSLRDVAFGELRRLRSRDMRGFLPKDTRLVDHERHYVQGYTAASGEGHQGRHCRALLLAYDEAVGIAPIFWQTGNSMYTGETGHYFLATYNPTDSSSEVYNQEQSGQWDVIVISQFEHPNVLAELRGEPIPYPDAVRLRQVVDAMDQYGTRLAPDAAPQENEVSLGLPGEPPLYRWTSSPLADCRVLGRWPVLGGASVWSEAMWLKMLAVQYEINHNWEIRIGCDVALMGDDSTAIVVRIGPCVVHAEWVNGLKDFQIAHRLKQLCEHYAAMKPANHWQREPRSIPCMIDAGGGWATGVFAHNAGFNFVPVLSILPANDADKYPNQRTELWFHTTEFANENAIDISQLPAATKNRLREELLAPNYDIDVKARKRVEPKTITKSKIRRSPDLADALNLTFHAT